MQNGPETQLLCGQAEWSALTPLCRTAEDKEDVGRATEIPYLQFVFRNNNKLASLPQCLETSTILEFSTAFSWYYIIFTNKSQKMLTCHIITTKFFYLFHLRAY